METGRPTSPASSSGVTSRTASSPSEESGTEAATATYLYDRNGNLKSAIDAAGSSRAQPSEIEADWNPFDEASEIRERLSGEQSWRRTTFLYDLNGNVRERSDQGLRHEFSYDQADWLVTQVDYDGQGALDRRMLTSYVATGQERERIIERYSPGPGSAGRRRPGTTSQTACSRSSRRGTGRGRCSSRTSSPT